MVRRGEGVKTLRFDMSEEKLVDSLTEVVVAMDYWHGQTEKSRVEK